MVTYKYDAWICHQFKAIKIDGLETYRIKRNITQQQKKKRKTYL